MNEDSLEKSSEQTENSSSSGLLEEFIKNGTQSFMELIKASNNLPIDQWDFFKTFPSFDCIIGPESKTMLEMLDKIQKHENLPGNISKRDDLEKFDMIVEANDVILERVDCTLDELQGIVKNPIQAPVVQYRSNYRKDNLIQNSQPENTVHTLVTSRMVVRPQAKFKDKIDNRNVPFEPRIKEKPNALKPLAILVDSFDEMGESFSHPYEYELDLFNPPKDQMNVCTPQKPKSLEETCLIFVKDLASLQSMIEQLKTCEEIAVDLEHHSYRSFQGFTCLIQISSRETDYIVDALDLRHELHILNEVFTDPKIVKVFHGSEHDIEWLQRDLSVYVVNMFDTHQAAQLLDFPRLSLAYLLKMYCNVDCNKRFQLFDWRIRPLPEEAIKYAREDTHYLLYVYDELKNALISKCQNNTNLLESIFFRSNQLCKRKYWKSRLTDESHLELYRKSRKMFDNRQMYALKHLYEWRDRIAREEDESVMYVLPNHMLLSIAENIPRELQGISALCNPVPPLVKRQEREIHKILLKAREQSLIKPILESDVHVQELNPNWVPVNVESKLYCPHDLSHCDYDVRNDLPTLLQSNLNVTSQLNSVLKNNKFFIDRISPSISVLGNQNGKIVSVKDVPLKTKEPSLKFVSPYQRYQKVIGFVAEEEKIKERLNQTDKTDGSNSNLDDSFISQDNSSEKDSLNYTITSVDDNQRKRKSDSSLSESVCPVKQVRSSDMSASTSKSSENSFSNQSNVRDDVSEAATILSAKNDVPTTPLAKNIKPINKNDMTNINDSVPIIMTAINDVTALVSTKIDTCSTMPSNRESKDVFKRKSISENGKEELTCTVSKKNKPNSESFVPYDYKGVDFSKFQSNTSIEKTKKQMGRRTPWLGKKGIHASIKKTIAGLKK